MKKIFVIVLTLLMILSLTACNMAVGPGSFSFKRVHVDTYHQNECFTIETWHDNESGIEVRTKEAGSMFFSEGTYILIADECPFCAEESEEAVG